MQIPETPRALKVWFVVHFVADVAVAVPLLVAPVWFLTLIRFESVDPIAARLVAAALFGIGIESFLMRRAPLDRFLPMLSLKIIWSIAAIVGFVWSILENVHGTPWSVWVFLSVFVAFNVLWIWWFRKVRAMLSG